MATPYLFNPERYLELYNKNWEFQKKGKTLSVTETAEFTSYLVQLESYILWKKESKLKLLIEAFINYEIDADKFDLKFHRLIGKNLELKRLHLNPSLDILKNIEIDPRDYVHFTNLRSNIMVACQLFESRIEDEDFSDDRFRDWVEKEYRVFLEYDSALVINVKSETDSIVSVAKNAISPIMSKTYSDQEVLRFTIIFFTILVSFAYTFLKPELFKIFWMSPFN